jgi:hypothetical protein
MRIRLTLLFAALAGIVHAQPAPAEPDFAFVLAAMKAERLKVRSGVCRITGTYTARNPQANQALEGPLEIFTAFDGNKIRFDRSQPGWVIDRKSARPHPSGEPGRATAEMKRGVEKYAFYDDGKKTALWNQDSIQMEILPSAAKTLQRFRSLGYFDVRGLGLYYHLAFQRQDRLGELFDVHAKAIVKPMVDRTNPDRWVLRAVDKENVMESESLIVIDVKNGFTPIEYTMKQRNHKRNEDWYTTQSVVTRWEKSKEVWVQCIARLKLALRLNPIRRWTFPSPGRN